MEIIVGIDLGTTNSEVACLRSEGRPEVIPVEGESIMPSCVGLDPDGRLLVGRTARNQMAAHPEQTILSIKRRMGEKITLPLGDRSFSPEEISSFILKKLKSAAESYLGQAVEKAVITVPAYFDDAQRQATKEAGTLAGLDVVRIINEPTAAALAYEAGHTEKQRILIYDLGGGTFDASLVEMENGIVEVKSSHGDTHLGGDDFDRLLIDHVTGIFKEKHAIDLKENLGAVNRLWVAVERAKRTLSDHPFASIREEFIAGEFHLDVEISRETYEEMIHPLLARTMSAVHACLRDANFLPRAIDKVILVGGSTRTPFVARIIEEEMGIVPHHEINPDLIVAMGASVQGAAMGGAKTSSILVDITPYTFGTRAIGDYRGRMIDDLYVPIIHRNTALPTGKEELFATSQDNQQEILVEIYQGDESLASDNIFIGNFWIKGLSKAKAGNLILLNLELDVNGILKVTAKEKSTGLVKTVTMDTANRGDDANVEEKRKNIASFLNDDDMVGDAWGDSDDEDRWEDDGDDEADDVLDINGGEDVANRDALLGRAKSLRKRAEAMIPGANAEDGQELRDLLEKSRQAIAAHDWPSVNRLNESLADMLFYLED